MQKRGLVPQCEQFRVEFGISEITPLIGYAAGTPKTNGFDPGCVKRDRANCAEKHSF
jgi:hypothetical protein